ncbi:MAG: hypothetical protein WA947_10330 [Phormidesmis sp.]
MSRYCVVHKVQDKRYWISFGWDFPLNTFFVQVESDDSEEPLLDIGSPFDCLYTQIEQFHEAFLEHLKKIGITDFSLSMEQKCHLLADKDGVGN